MKLKESEAMEDREVEDADDPDGGDTIGDTAYSKRFVLRTLVSLGKINEEERTLESVEDVEDDLCVLWDMTAERAVAEYIVAMRAYRTIAAALAVDGARLSEICVGILANVVCHEGVPTEGLVRELGPRILEALAATDAPLVVQALRFASATARSDPDDGSLARMFAEARLVERVAAIMENSINEEALAGCLNALALLLSREDPPISADAALVRGTFTAHDELDRLAGAERAWRTDFLTVHRQILNSPDNDALYRDRAEELLERARRTVEISLEEDALEALAPAEATVGILGSLGFPESEAVRGITDAFVLCWTALVDRDRADAAEDLVNHFIRIVKLWPADKVAHHFENTDVKYLRLLKNATKDEIDSMEEGQSNYFKDVPSAIEKIIASKTVH